MHTYTCAYAHAYAKCMPMYVRMYLVSCSQHRHLCLSDFHGHLHQTNKYISSSLSLSLSYSPPTHSPLTSLLSSASPLCIRSLLQFLMDMFTPHPRQVDALLNCVQPQGCHGGRGPHAPTAPCHQTDSGHRRQPR